MPPKRKRAGEAPAANAPARATRSSTRSNKTGGTGSPASVASTSNATQSTTKRATKADVNNEGEVAPTTKRAKSTKAAATKEKAPRTTARSKKSTTTHPNQSATDDVARTQKESPEAKASVSSKKSFEPYTPKAAERLFESYADQDDSAVIGAEGFERLFTDAGIPLDGAMPLLLAWQLEEAEMAKITRVNWVKGMGELQISSLIPLALALNELYDLIILSKPPNPVIDQKKSGAVDSAGSYSRKRYLTYARNSPKAFSDFYAFCYKLATQPGSRNIEMETALTLWAVVLAPTQPVLLEITEFINEAGSYKAANKDLWSMMLEFCRTIKPDLSNFEADGAWPTMIDDFVEWKKAKDRPLGEQPINVE